MRAVPSRLAKVTLLVLLVFTIGAAAFSARAQSASTYQMSCNGIGAAGSTMFANCRRINGSFSRTSIQIRGIENINGALRFSGMGQTSTFQNSCSHIGVAGSTLYAACRRIDGGFERASILIPGIENIDGQLHYQ
jgi:CVNH domain